MGGRKAKPAEMYDMKKAKKSNAFLEARKNTENRLKTDNNLSCPKELSSVAQKEWRRVMRLYRKMDAKIMNDLDISALSMYCEAVAMWKEAQAQWKACGKVFSEDKDEQRTLNKVRSIMNEQVKVVISLAEQLCLSPVGRARFGIGIANKSKEEQELEGLKELMSGD